MSKKEIVFQKTKRLVSTPKPVKCFQGTITVLDSDGRPMKLTNDDLPDDMEIVPLECIGCDEDTGPQSDCPVCGLVCG